MLFAHPPTAALTLARHAEGAWRHRRTVAAVLKRDGDRCHRCGTRVGGWMEIDHLDRDHDNWSPDNLAAICQFCHLGLHPAQPGFGNDPPLVLLHLPGMTQQAVTALAWAIIRCRDLARQREHGGDDEVAGATRVRAVLRDFLTDIDSLEMTARRLAGEPASLLLQMTLVAGAEPDHWRGLRWWPQAAGDNGELFRWLPGGLERVPAIEVGASVSPPAASV